MSLTPEQYIKKAILLEVVEYNKDIKLAYLDYEEDGAEIEVLCTLSSETIDDEYDNLKNLYDEIIDCENDFRERREVTDVVGENFSRYYDCEEVGFRVADGVWVGFTYWSGGGKFGEPESIDCTSGAYFLDVKEEVKLVVVREFSKSKEK